MTVARTRISRRIVAKLFHRRILGAAGLALAPPDHTDIMLYLSNTELAVTFILAFFALGLLAPAAHHFGSR
jgi:hypothetical protein